MRIKYLTYLVLLLLLTITHLSYSQDIGKVRLTDKDGRFFNEEKPIEITGPQINYSFFVYEQKALGIAELQIKFHNVKTNHGFIWETVGDPKMKYFVMDEKLDIGTWQIIVMTMDDRVLGRSAVFAVK